MIAMTGRMPVVQNPAYRPTRLAFTFPLLSYLKLRWADRDKDCMPHRNVDLWRQMQTQTFPPSKGKLSTPRRVEDGRSRRLMRDSTSFNPGNFENLSAVFRFRRSTRLPWAAHFLHTNLPLRHVVRRIPLHYLSNPSTLPPR